VTTRGISIASSYASRPICWTPAEEAIDVGAGVPRPTRSQFRLPDSHPILQHRQQAVRGPCPAASPQSAQPEFALTAARPHRTTAEARASAWLRAAGSSRHPDATPAWHH
jgi:hypothetical protein